VTSGAHETTVRVRYDEVDRMGVVHHSHYLDYFEQGRTELLRSLGRTYRDVEESGTLLVVAAVEIRFHRPARYDDLLTVRTRPGEVTGARVVFEYEVDRPSDGVRIATGRTVLASTDPRGRPVRMPSDLLALFGAPPDGKAADPQEVQSRS
jgi:acyl-CoA thioester hydrolase